MTAGDALGGRGAVELEIYRKALREILLVAGDWEELPDGGLRDALHLVHQYAASAIENADTLPPEQP